MIVLVTNSIRRLRSRLPVLGQQYAEVVLIGHRGQTSEHVTQVGQRIYSAMLVGDDQGVEDGRALASCKVSVRPGTS